MEVYGMLTRGHRHWRGLKLTPAWVACACLLLLSFSRPVSGDLANETAALLNIKAAWGNPSALNTWTAESGAGVCSWEFVTCDFKNSSIIKLLIDGVPVFSSFPESFGLLVNLQVLALSDMGLIGPIPESIGQLANLTKLNLNTNALNGSIPAAIANLSYLTILDLGGNALSGTLPSQLSNLTQLISVNLGTNNLTGAIPAWIDAWTQLQDLTLSTNYFQGDLPPQIGNLTRLQKLILTAAGSFNGLPTELGNLVSLQTLSLSDNFIGGSIPDSFGRLLNLISFDMESSLLTGSIPASLGNLTVLNEIDFSSNKLSSSIPTDLGNLTNLGHLYLDQNQLSGILPLQFGGLSQLTLLSISSNQLTGPIPPEYGRLINLTYLDLHGNELSGSIPNELTQLLNIVTIDLSDNFLTGSIPQNITELLSLNTLFLEDNCLNGSVPDYNTSNSDLQFDFGDSNSSTNCFNTSQVCLKCAVLSSTLPTPTAAVLPTNELDQKSKKSGNQVYVAIGVVVGSLVAFTALAFVIGLRRQKLRPKSSIGTSITYKAPVKQYTLLEVLTATDNLTAKVGEGAYATVYKGIFKDGDVEVLLAVKHFNKKKPAESFELEAELHAHLNHRFLLNLVGFCEEEGELMLMYDFMDRGNLFENLHGSRSSIPLTWDERVKILINVARGIEYLHNGTDRTIIHRDIKSANILLSSDGCTLIAKLADFGLGKKTAIEADELTPAFGQDPPQPSPTKVAGTAGYMDPEYCITSLLSPKSDVYSFGVVLLELITGKQSVFFDDNEDVVSLVLWAKPFLDAEKLWTILDPKLERGKFPEGQVVAVAALARHCIEHDNRKRPTMVQIMKFLSGIFGSQTNEIDISFRSLPTEEDFSGASADFLVTLNQLRDLILKDSMKQTQSEILPRD